MTDPMDHPQLDEDVRLFAHKQNRCRECLAPKFFTPAWGWYCGTNGCKRRQTDVPEKPWPLVQVIGAIPGEDARWAWEVARRFMQFMAIVERDGSIECQLRDDLGYPDGDGCECCDTAYPYETMGGIMEGYYEPEWSGYCDACLNSGDGPGGVCSHGCPLPCELGVPCEPYDHGPGAGIMCLWCWRELMPFRPLMTREGVIGCFTCKKKIWKHELPAALERHEGHNLNTVIVS